jgi:hypothetical protein
MIPLLILPRFQFQLIFVKPALTKVALNIKPLTLPETIIYRNFVTENLEFLFMASDCHPGSSREESNDRSFPEFLFHDSPVSFVL